MTPTSTAMIHELKTLPEFFGAVITGDKRFEIRKDDRGGFKPGDFLNLREWDSFNHYSGRTFLARVTYVTDYAQQPGFVVMGLAAAPPPSVGEDDDLEERVAHLSSSVGKYRLDIDAALAGLRESFEGHHHTYFDNRPDGIGRTTGPLNPTPPEAAPEGFRHQPMCSMCDQIAVVWDKPVTANSYRRCDTHDEVEAASDADPTEWSPGRLAEKIALQTGRLDAALDAIRGINVTLERMRWPHTHAETEEEDDFAAHCEGYGMGPAEAEAASEAVTWADLEAIYQDARNVAFRQGMEHTEPDGIAAVRAALVLTPAPALVVTPSLINDCLTSWHRGLTGYKAMEYALTTAAATWNGATR